MFHGVMPVQGGAHRPRLEEWHPFSAQVANYDDVCANKQTSSSRNLTYITRLHPCATAIVQAHSRQRRRSSSPKEYICYTKLTRGAWMFIHPARRVLRLSSTKILQPCATLLVEDKLLQAQIGHDGETSFISQYIRAGLVPVATTGAPSPTTGLNQTFTAKHPSPIVPTIQPTEFCGSL